MLGANCRTSSSSWPSPHLSSPSTPANGNHQNILNMSPSISWHLNPIAQSERTLHDQSSLCWDSKKELSCTSVTLFPSNGTAILQSSAELRKEIATLEAEIMGLERYLLSLYRTAFEDNPSAISNNTRTQSQYKTGSPSQVIVDQSHHKMDLRVHRGVVHRDQISPAHGWVSSDNQSLDARLMTISTTGQKNAHPRRRSLAEHLGSSCINNTLNTPDRLSEDIVRCISSIYCKLANSPHGHTGSSASSTSSLSSSSIFSSRNPCDSWSPQCNGDGAANHRGLKEENGPYTAMIEVLKICLDDDTFKYAATMLQNFRSLVRGLEKVDPLNMKREEKLAFWINIHNALVMHAHLAYGTQNRVKSTSILKAAYNVGGHCIDAYVVQSSILGISSHYSAPWLQTLFSPRKKSKAGCARHVYAMEYPELLVHFSLCSGAYSDPAVRVYTAKTVFQDLKLAKEEFIQANVYIHKEKKISLPKILGYFAKDMSLSMPELLELVNGCLSKAQQKSIRKCLKGRLDKCIEWQPQSSAFRYVIHGDLAKMRTVA